MERSYTGNKGGDCKGGDCKGGDCNGEELYREQERGL